MAEGLLDMFVSHRTKFNQCYFYKKYITGENTNNISYNDIPSGVFYAEEYRAYQNNSQVIGGTVMIESITVVLKTEDNIEELEVNDQVEWDNEKWRVMNIQKSKIMKENQFASFPHFEYFIELKR